VIQLHQPANGEDAGFVMRPRLSMQLLKRVLVDGGHSIGQRVLVAGTGCDELIEWLNSLGLDADSLGKTSIESTAGDSIESMFDLILVDDFDRYRGNLLDLGLRSVTAQLLSRLKPGGDLVVIRDAARGPVGDSSNSTSHDAVCWTRHLACFPGRLETTEFSASWFSRSTWNWMLGRGAVPAELTVSLRIPSERLTVEQWQDHARRGLLTGAACCCSATLPLQRQCDAA